MKEDALFGWLCKEERSGLLQFILWVVLVIIGPFPIIWSLCSFHYNGHHYPCYLYTIGSWIIPFLSLMILSESKKVAASFSKAYLCGFVGTAVMSVIYIGYIMFKGNDYPYDMVASDLIRSLIIVPLCLAGTSLFFFIIEVILNTIKRRTENK